MHEGHRHLQNKSYLPILKMKKKNVKTKGKGKNLTWSLSFATFMVFFSHTSNNKTGRKGRVGL